jgi:hypothetical protein
MRAQNASTIALSKRSADGTDGWCETRFRAFWLKTQDPNWAP